MPSSPNPPAPNPTAVLLLILIIIIMEARNDQMVQQPEPMEEAHQYEEDILDDFMYLEYLD